MTNRPWKGRGYGYMTHLNFYSPPKKNIFRTAQARHFKFLYTLSPYDVLALGLQTVPWVDVVSVTWGFQILANKW